MQNLDDGLRDAANLAWKLALVWHRHAGDTLLDSYEAERRTAVGARLRAVDQAMPLLRPVKGWERTRRSLLSGSFRKHAPLLADGVLGTGRFGSPPAYPAGPPGPRGRRPTALSQDLAPTEPGVLVPDVPVIAADGSHDRLHQRLGRGLVLVLVAPGTGV
jgi:3-(3-hydroxy-phenyl)propionate hydroxylase